jgi:hypothetical protein
VYFSPQYLVSLYHDEDYPLPAVPTDRVTVIVETGSNVRFGYEVMFIHHHFVLVLIQKLRMGKLFQIRNMFPIFIHYICAKQSFIHHSVILRSICVFKSTIFMKIGCVQSPSNINNCLLII